LDRGEVSLDVRIKGFNEINEWVPLEFVLAGIGIISIKWDWNTSVIPDPCDDIINKYRNELQKTDFSNQMKNTVNQINKINVYAYIIYKHYEDIEKALHPNQIMNTITLINKLGDERMKKYYEEEKRKKTDKGELL